MSGYTAYTILNEIMSNKNDPCIILNSFDGEHVGFLADLANNYKDAIWFHYEYECEYPFVYTLVKKFLRGSEALRKAYAYVFATFPEPDENVLLKYLIECVAERNENALLILAGVNGMSERETEQMEYLLRHCPKNLKIVLVCDTLPKMDYTAMVDEPPSIFTQGDMRPVVLPPVENPLTEEEGRMLYAISKHGFVSYDFARYLYGERLEKLPRYVSQKYRSVVLRAGEIFIVSERIQTILKRFETDEFEGYDEKNVRLLTERGRLIPALHLALTCGMICEAEKICARIVGDDAFLSDVLFYGKRNGGKLVGREIDTPYLSIVRATYDIYHNDLARVTNTLAALTTREFPPQVKAFLTKLTCAVLEKSGKKEAIKAVAEEAYRALVDENDDTSLGYVTPFLGYFLGSGRKSDALDKVSAIERLEKYFTSDCPVDSIRYVACRKCFAEFYVGYGNYTAASKHVAAIKEELPFYPMPMDIVGAALLAGDVEASKKWAKEALEIGLMFAPDGHVSDVRLILSVVAYYLGKEEEATEEANAALADAKEGTTAFLRALCVKTVLLSEMGKADQACKIAGIYLAGKEPTAAHDALRAAIAYGYCLSDRNEEALAYATDAYNRLPKRSPYRLVAGAVRLKVEIEEHASVAAASTEKLLAEIERYGLGMLIVVLGKCFKRILDYAEDIGIQSPYIMYLQGKVNERNSVLKTTEGIKVNVFGATTVTFDDKEIKWRTKKSKDLFILYVLAGENGVSRKDLLSDFWGDFTDESAINNLKTNNHIIRTTMASYGIPCELIYANLKYTLRVNVTEGDYLLYKKLSGRVEREKDPTKKAVFVSHLVRMFGEGFAPDIDAKYFRVLRDKMREELIALTVRTVKELTLAREEIEARSFLTILKKMMHTGEYTTLVADLERMKK